MSDTVSCDAHHIAHEAVFRGLDSLADVGWESNSGETIGEVEVEIHQEPTRHIVNVPRLFKWVNEKSGYPGEETRKEKRFCDSFGVHLIPLLSNLGTSGNNWSASMFTASVWALPLACV